MFKLVQNNLNLLLDQRNENLNFSFFIKVVIFCELVASKEAQIELPQQA